MLSISALGCLPQFVMSHKYVLGERANATLFKRNTPTMDRALKSPAVAAGPKESSTDTPPTSTVAIAPAAADEVSPASASSASSSWKPSSRREKDNTWKVRWGIFAYDLFRVFFSGLALKFFGLFFQVAYGMSPLTLAYISAARPLTSMVCTWVAGKACAYVRRDKVCCVLLVVCNAASFWLAYGHPWDNVWLDSAAWIVQSGTLSAVFGLKKSILMDNVSQKNRSDCF